MDTLPKPAPLEIEVADFGPIVHAKVDLRPMTVFIGPSNTGKSYLAILLYALHRFFGAGGGLYGFASPAYRGFRSNPNRMPELPDETVADFQDLAQTIVAVNAGASDGDIALPDRVRELMRLEFDDLGNALGSEIVRCYGMDNAAMLARKGHNTRARVAIRHRSPDSGKLEHTLDFNAGEVAFQSAMPPGIPAASIRRSAIDFVVPDAGLLLRQPGRAFDAFESIYLLNRLMTLAVPGMVGSFQLPAYYFPADRTGVMHAHSAIVSAMIGNAPLSGSQQSGRTPMLSGVLADFLRRLIEVYGTPRRRPSEHKQHQPRDDAGREIEKAILRGEVRVERSELINYPHFTYRPDGWKDDLPLMNASSMVSEIAPLVLYLRHIVQPGDVLIIEEPESHLHPAMQVEFTRQLAKLVQRGYRVIITTHSEWVLEELGNVVQRSRLPAKARATIPNGEVALSDDQVGVWLFRPKPRGRARGSEVARVSLGETGLYDAGFDDVAIALSNDGARIFERTGGNK